MDTQLLLRKNSVNISFSISEVEDKKLNPQIYHITENGEAEALEVTTTDYAWRNLLDGKADLLLVYEPSSETKKIIEESNVKLTITPIGVDALVFLLNENNKVDGFTTKQLRDIYSGKIKNWKDVGGDDMNIDIICIGKIKESFYREALNEYAKRLSKYCKLNITELADEQTPDNASENDCKKILDAEGDRILQPRSRRKIQAQIHHLA